MKIFILSFCLILCLTACEEEKSGIPEANTLSAESNTSYSASLPDEKTSNVKDVPEEIPVGPEFLNSYSTKILTTDTNRYNNISIVADRLHEYELPAGSEFSYNEVCGPYGQSDGFLEADILLSDGTETKGFGGGVCQLSSTLYNAVKDLDVTIIEHHHHSSPVAYVPVNQDATVSLQSDLDFKFTNNYPNTLIFKTSHDPNNLTVSVYLDNEDNA